MPRREKEFETTDPGFLSKALHWANGYGHFAYFNHNNLPYPFGPFPHLLAVGAKNHVSTSSSSISTLEDFHSKHKDWIFGYFAYDLKNEMEDLGSNNPATIPTENINFFSPRHLIQIGQDGITLASEADPQRIFHSILKTEPNPLGPDPGERVIKAHTSKERYIENVRKIQRQIVEGEFYEMNYCMEFSLGNITIDPVSTYQSLNAISPMPFSSLAKFGGTYIISASPERFIKKVGKTLVSQPIKGTIRRGKDAAEDERLKSRLKHSEKERAENMMIVDLVRNDLAKSALAGTVKVEEMFGIYTFKQLHQMISTVSAVSNERFSPFETIANAFPMGSMTGAPKIRVMEEIEKMEDTTRGVYSGALGYFTPEGDFDFSVVIRSIVYDHKNNRLCFHVGSAITYDADAEQEYEECLLKAQAVFDWIERSTKM